MRKLCHCGQEMSLDFRVLIFEGIIEIDRVPVFECEQCSHYEVLPAIKPDLLALLAELKASREQGLVLFNEVSELADVMYGIYRTWSETESPSFESLLDQKCKERINLLLDVYGCAKGMEDQDWMEDISKRLAQISDFVNNSQFSRTN
ncbi:hypothetical protein [Paenibacillus woosongensis]|uniref:Uncharacterized protein n=1 Tax=Paenibacillus woosongensis TaxID=307580 RepID=A0A7X2YZY9_9BACL|nr:hypothetical protein [Paenibacillus woosongensis]MUG44913.1 hypothetical protein [Paenibacillus woosongensis]